MAACLVALLGSAGVAAAETPAFSSTPLASWRLNGVGYAAVVVGGTAYVGGSFTTATSPSGATTASRANLAAFDVRTGALVTTFRADTNGTVRALASDGSRLYVGGGFSRVNGAWRPRVAALSLTTGAVVPGWGAEVADGRVHALSVGPGRLYLGGTFGRVDGTTRQRLAALRLSDSALEPWAPAANGSVTTVAAAPNGSHVYVGGHYSSLAGVPSQRLTKLTAAGAVVPMTWRDLSGPALDLQVSPDSTRLAVAVGGRGNQGAYYDAGTGRRLWRQRCDGDGQAVLLSGDQMFTGFHEGCNGDGLTKLTSNSLSSGSRNTAFTPRFNRFMGVWDISGSRSGLVVAGDFTRVSGRSVQGFAVFPPR